MTSTGQSCTLCSQPLLQYLFNADGDYILNCSSPTCLYGVLHARVFKANDLARLQSLPVATATSTGDDMPDFSSMLNNSNEYAASPNDHHHDSIGQLDLPEHGLSAKEDRMIDSWVQELVNASQEPPSADAPGPPMVEAIAPQCTSEVKPKRARTTKRAGNTSAVRTTAELTTSESETKIVRETQRPKRVVQRGLAGSAILRKAQAKAAALRANMDLLDETPSESGSSDSGVHSDLSTGSANAAMTPIQRLLHIEEAKKRSWGTTGMPGYKPSATTASRIKLF